MKKKEKILLEEIRESNDLLRSAYQIAIRRGERTNWDTWILQLKKALDRQNELLRNTIKKV